MKVIKKIVKKIKSAFSKGGADEWGKKQMKEMAKLRGKLILM